MIHNMAATNQKKMGYSWELMRIGPFTRKVDKKSQHTFSTKFMCIEDARRVMDGYPQEERCKLALVITEIPRMAYPLYATSTSRLKTFQQWPPAMPFSFIIMLFFLIIQVWSGQIKYESMHSVHKDVCIW
jgi:hypothetical protein